MKNPKEVLIEKKIKITSAKVDLLSLLIHEERALSFTEIMGRLQRPCHKTSLYRILTVFTFYEIIDRIIDSEGIAYFIFNQHLRSNTVPKWHLYFKCLACGQIKKVINTPSECFNVWLGQTGQIATINLLAEGKCKTCIIISD